ncbi:MAG TPA: PDZ domain-containing protein [Thermoanaerobaculia bacterium]|nr:PDZ domain-containing protein [Thermoanaerobaculia bacterium]
MTTAFLKAAPLALLLLLPTLSSARAGDKPQPKKEKEVVVDADPIVTLEDEDGPVIIGSDQDEDTAAVVAGAHSARRGFLGVQLIDITEDLRAHFGAPRDAGVLVSEVEKDSPAAKAGVSVGDVITRIDGYQMESARDVTRAIRHKKKGDVVKIDVQRAKAARTLSATLEERKGRELELGDLGLHGMHGRIVMPHDFDLWIPDIRLHGLDDLSHLQEKLEDLDKRLKDLEKKVH